MPSTYTTNNGIELIANGEQTGTWGDTTNDNLSIIDRLVTGVGSISLSGTTHTLTTSDGTLSDGMFRVLVFGGSPSGSNTVTISPNTQQKFYVVRNNSGQSVVLTQGSGGNVTVANGTVKLVYADGAGASAQVFDLTGALAMSAPVLGTPASGTLTNATGLPISTGVSGLGTSVATALAVNVGSSGAVVVNGGALGTPASGTVTNLTGTASININGTVGATTPTTAVVTTLTANTAVSTDTINEKTAAAGVTIDGVLLKDGNVTAAGATAAQDGIAITGRAGGTSSYRATFVPTTLSASRTLTVPDATGTLLTTAAVGNGLGVSGSNIVVTPNTTNGSLVDVTSSGVRVGNGSNAGFLQTLLGYNNSTASNATSDIVAAINTSNASVRLFVSGGSGTPTAGLFTGSACATLQFQNNTHLWANQAGTTEYMRMNATGLGIGTSSPGHRLSVVGAAGTHNVAIFQNNDASFNTDVTVNHGSAAGNLLLTRRSGGEFWIYQSGSHATRVYTNALERMAILSDGNVGIGTTSPITRLHVLQSLTGSQLIVADSQTNSANKSGTLATQHYTNTEEPPIAIGVTTTSTTNVVKIGGGYGEFNAATKIEFITAANNTTTGGSERMSILSDGNVGIGTSSPANLLQVNGSIGRTAPVTKTGNFTLAATDNWVICNGSGSITVTLPAASIWTAREVMIKTIAAQTVVSASSNVVPVDGSAAGTAILAATAGKWATLVSDGTNWIIMAAN